MINNTKYTSCKKCNQSFHNGYNISILCKYEISNLPLLYKCNNCESTWGIYTLEFHSNYQYELDNIFLKDEVIISSAVLIEDYPTDKCNVSNIDKGFVVCGRRHSDCYKTIEIIGNLDLSKYKYKAGFITSFNRFLDRHDAFKLALRQGQIKYGYNTLFSDGSNENVLISEHLFSDIND